MGLTPTPSVGGERERERDRETERKKDREEGRVRDKLDTLTTITTHHSPHPAPVGCGL